MVSQIIASRVTVAALRNALGQLCAATAFVSTEIVGLCTPPLHAVVELIQSQEGGGIVSFYPVGGSAMISEGGARPPT